MNAAFPAVSVGKTDYPLRSSAELRGPLVHFTPSEEGDALFRVLDGPPYANGAPHLGHVLNKHLKDAVARAASEMGRNVEWRPGWDCHGLPLELAVEKLGVDRKDRPLFLQSARDFASSQVALQADVFQAQGWSASWDHPWRTQDPEMEAGTLRVLADLLDRDLLDVRFAAVPWCTRCGSTLSGAEQEEKSWTTAAWVVPFELDDGAALLSWTTTPWTLPLHRALVLNPDAVYTALEKDGALAWVSSDTADQWASALGASRTGRERLGRDFEGAHYSTPWKRGVVCVDHRVLPGAGTGALHAVPGLSELDTALGESHGWALVQHLTPDGFVQKSACEAQNGTRAGTSESKEAATAAYQEGVWFLEQPYTTQHPHCWRHLTPLLTRASRQVFLRLDADVRDRAVDMVSQMRFTPESARTRLLAAMKDRPDWCLSRQRTWGVPLALFLDKASGKPHANASTWMRRVADQVALDGVSAWSSVPSEHWLQGDARLSDLDRVDDVLDVWFDSGCVPQLVGQADMVVEGTDQHRGWFQSCLWVAAALDAGLPFKHVACHGFVMGGNGKKLSKSDGGDSKGGGKAPAWHTLPTDVVRLWALTGTEGSDKAWSMDTVQNAQSACARLRNVLRFLLSNMLDECQADVEASRLHAWDRYWWKKSSEMADRVLHLCAQAKVGEAMALVVPFAEVFSSVVLGSWKDRLYCAPAHTQERQDLDWVMRGCLEAWGKMLGVLTPRLRDEASAYWPALSRTDVPDVSEEEVKEVEWMLGLRSALGPRNEVLGRSKVAPGARDVVCDLPFVWPGQLMADALDVGQVKMGMMDLSEDAVQYDGRMVFLMPSSDMVCPRCRRAQPGCVDYCAACKKRCDAH